MKQLIIITFFLMSSVVLVAQPTFDLGIKAGINNSKVTFRASEYNSESIVKAHFGAFGRLGWGRIYVQPEAYFSSKGGEVFEEGTPSERAGRFDYNNIDIPVLLGVKVINGGMANVRVMAGPVFSVMTSNKIDGNDLLNKQYYEDNYFGYQYGIGVDVSNFFIDARMEHGGELYKHPTLDIDGKNQTFMITVGFKIL
ncbi:PorT family protein [Mariniphaga sediminis]|jgi:hypothetical protein|uniref:PorT family protein n=1 Tax=Mariniphaga sediminis TaxID=1628158 RepID=A0A399CZZ7_9BACT|nr:porin family protein [Mariniphaga sediminis]RIH64072.1 PorT family protein [Mariniphaga sediminis]